jgi:hypothetical protein
MNCQLCNEPTPRLYPIAGVNACKMCNSFIGHRTLSVWRDEIRTNTPQYIILKKTAPIIIKNITRLLGEPEIIIPEKVPVKRYRGQGGWKLRYTQAHFRNTEKKHPHIISDGLYTEPLLPSVATANGMKQAMENYCDWTGIWSIRVNVFGGEIKTKEIKTSLGVSIVGKTTKTKSTTKKGSSDFICGPNGYLVCMEIKAEGDKPRPAQLEQQEFVRSSCGCYEFIHNMDEFFIVLDVFLAMPKNSGYGILDKFYAEQIGGQKRLF